MAAAKTDLADATKALDINDDEQDFSDARDDDESAYSEATDENKSECTSSVSSAEKWLLKHPQAYIYEDEYVTGDGEIDDEQEKPNLQNYYTNIPSRLFKLRGTNYLSEKETNNKKLKVPSEKAAYSCVGLNVFQAGFNLAHAAEKVASLRKYLDDMEKLDEKQKDKNLKGDAPKYLILSWVFSNFFKTEYTAVVHVLRRNMPIDSNGNGECPVLDRTLSRWLALPDEEKNLKLKYACILKEASSQLKGAIDMLGGERPVLIGKRLTTTYHKGENYLEVDMDVGSSNIASMLNGIIIKSSGSFVIDECFCIEAQEEDELPERALCTIRWNRCSLEHCGFKLDEMGNIIQ
uniref:Protein ENHANCED DISEASE RESISTANCE 2 C-terminal domain-containing protein n=1 Tax=Mucochytrium quahogii TaxID=96639 RepID=A0A7S2W3E6_9STRA|mmetsp:Transcript_12614/g.20373  ORF Transcript_12614/g.20373 Transcript_12614/m.20373 type:complete len:349 (+) Transcript_12614:57-1103(+)|eukprot:CAMPEP_0203744770 /NCGR_PEP_ID=MMETSP0098-20131031/738_1 /ASSEMBLY_ACC=CAM_ASM_000208 /TAXON_ID=96639 /ORGANISM=" , Strain NY0313808BC1" /LENGTH=348 /DNA_ID=CAMNT_0050632387 /DNA_START=108 /DNA_END=1154 /DNA_ORIENTATION=+